MQSQTENTIDAAAILDPPSSIFDSRSLPWRALATCTAEIRSRLKRFDEELIHLRRGFYAPEIRAASLLFQQAGSEETGALARASDLLSRIARPISILVVVEPSVAHVPHPKVFRGRLLEPHFRFSDSDRAALESALRFRDQAAVPVAIQVAAVGSRGMAPVLRETLSLGVDRARLVVPPTDGVTPQSAARALAAVIGSNTAFDLVLGGAGSGDHEEGLLARLTAQALHIPYAGSSDKLALEVNGTDFNSLILDEGHRQRVRPLPAAAAVKAGLPLREFTVGGYLTSVSKNVEVIRWPKKIEVTPITFVESTPFLETQELRSETSGLPLSPPEAASRLLQEIGLSSSGASTSAFNGPLETVLHPSLLENGRGSGRVVAVLASDAAGRLQPSAAATFRCARTVANLAGGNLAVLLLCPQGEEIERTLVGQLLSLYRADVVLFPAAEVGKVPEITSRILADCWPELSPPPRIIVGEPWTEEAFASLSSRQDREGRLALRVHQIASNDGELALVTRRANGKLNVRQRMDWNAGLPIWISLAPDAVIDVEPEAIPGGLVRVQRWTPRLERFFGQGEIRRLLDEVKEETGLARLSDAAFIVDVGFGVGNRDGYEAVIEPLTEALRELGVRSLVVGGSRKVTEELHLLPPDRQIGQSGASVNPQILLAIGISGAPQHLNYIGPRATILAFNRDPEAPIMTLNQRQPRPRVFPIVGDLFETVPALIAALKTAERGQVEAPAEAVKK